jgi:hypothetical protein
MKYDEGAPEGDGDKPEGDAPSGDSPPAEE